MAKRSDDGSPQAADVVRSFTFFPGNSTARLDLLETLGVTSGLTSNEIIATIVTGAYGGNAGPLNSSNSGTASSYQMSLSRSAFMRGWRL